MDFKEIKLFDGKTYEDLIKDIYVKSLNKDTEIKNIIASLSTSMDKTPEYVSSWLPSLVEYTEVSIKNNDQLIKLAGIIQRFFSKNINNDGSAEEISQEEKEELLRSLKQIKSEEQPSASGG